MQMDPQPASPKAGIYLAIPLPTPVPHFAQVGPKKAVCKTRSELWDGYHRPIC